MEFLRASGLAKIARLLLIVFAIWAVVTQGPVSWYLVGSVVIWLVLMNAAGFAKGHAADNPRVWRKVVAGSLEDGTKIARNLAIGACIVLFVQLALNLLDLQGSANTIGTIEQRLWDTIAALRPLTSLRTVALVLLGVMIVSALTRSHLPVVVSSKARKLLGATVALLGSVAMFTFVTADTAQANHTRLSAPIRAVIAAKLTETAKARKEAAAYRWIAEAVERKKQTEPEQVAASKAYFAEGERICDDFERIYKQGAPADAVIGYVPALQPIDGDLYVQPEAPVRLIPDDNLCYKPVFAGDLVSHLVDAPELDVAIPPDTGFASTWLPEFADRIGERSWEPGDTFSELREGVDVKTIRLALLDALKQEASKAATDAGATRSAMRSLAVKAASDLVGTSFGLEGIAEKLVDALRDAVLTELASKAEGKLKERLRSAAQGESPVARAAEFMGQALFPRLLIDETAVGSGLAALAAAKQAWDSAHPDATTAAAVRDVTKASLERGGYRPAPFDSGSSPGGGSDPYRPPRTDPPRRGPTPRR